MLAASIENRRRPSGLLLSLAAHAFLIGVTSLLLLHTGTVRPVYHESRCCAQPLYWSGSTGSGNAKPRPASTKKRTNRALQQPASPATGSPSPLAVAQNKQAPPGIAAPQQTPTIGTGTGTESAEPAFPVYYPSPGVSDRSLLPSAEQKVIVDVSVSALGEVTDEKLVQGLGNNIDQIVLSTVKGWRFHPATLNGTAIASVEELVFPFNRDYPESNG